MKVAEISRFPIKSLLGERLDDVEIEQRGLIGDRLWAVRDVEGKIGSGKNTRRFRRMPGLLHLRGYFGERVPTVELPGGETFDADDPAGHAAVSHAIGRNVTIAREAEVQHHDEGPVSLITTAGLRQLAAMTGEPVDPARFRANLLIDLPGTGFLDDSWVGQDLQVGPTVLLRPQALQTRCIMINMAQGDLPESGRLLKAVAERPDLTFGLWATVIRAGRIAVGDAVTVNSRTLITAHP